MATSQSNIDPNYLLRALEWHIDHGADEVLNDEPVDKTAIAAATSPIMATNNTAKKPAKQKTVTATIAEIPTTPTMGAAQAIIEAEKLATSAQSLQDLKSAIENFTGLSIRDTASQIVFADGNPEAKIMVIGDYPRTDDDKNGRAFTGAMGQLQDKILASIGLARDKADHNTAVYMTNLLNWRPPGNRSPTQTEIDISLPFLKKHITLVKHDIIISSSATAAKALLGKTESISKLRGKFYDYNGAQMFVTYHPEYLLKTPAQKRAVWADMLMLQAYLQDSTS